MSARSAAGAELAQAMRDHLPGGMGSRAWVRLGYRHRRPSCSFGLGEVERELGSEPV